MNIRELRGILVQLQRLYGAGGAKSAEKDLTTVSAALEPYEGKSVKEFVAGTREKLAAKDKERTKSGANVDEDNIERQLQRLLEVGTDRIAFYVVFEELKKDKRINVADADIIARKYTGYKARYKKKQTAFDDIEKVFIERARFENKMSATS
jgi:hypothetical protein